MEYLDTYDENGKFIKKEERKKVHELGLWHNTVHCWLYDSFGNVFFQIRKDKKKLYTTASGHVKSGETIKEAFGREVEEEIGYKVDYEKADFISIVNFKMDRLENDGTIFKDRAFSNVYALEFNDSMKLFDFDEEELLGIVKINASKTLEILKNEKGSLTGEICYKKNGEINIKKDTIKFEDFLVNDGENAFNKYKDVLENIIIFTKSI